MNRAQDPDLSAAQMQLLWVGNNEKEFAYLRDVLTAKEGWGWTAFALRRKVSSASTKLPTTSFSVITNPATVWPCASSMKFVRTAPAHPLFSSAIMSIRLR